MRLRGRTDSNQNAVIRDLRKMGASVFPMSSLGSGYPDIAVGWHGANYFFEIKDPMQPPSKRKLTDDEKDFHLAWNGQVAVITSAESAMDIMCLIPNARYPNSSVAQCRQKLPPPTG
jgi:hypothetical protein